MRVSKSITVTVINLILGISALAILAAVGSLFLYLVVFLYVLFWILSKAWFGLLHIFSRQCRRD